MAQKWPYSGHFSSWKKTKLFIAFIFQPSLLKEVVRRCDMTKCTVRKVKGKLIMNFCNYCKRPLQNSYFQLLFRHHFANDIHFNIKKQVISSHVIFRQTAHSYFLEELLPCSNCVPFLSSLCSKKKISPFQKTRVHVIAVPVGNLFETVGSPEDFSGTPAVPVRYSLSQPGGPDGICRDFTTSALRSIYTA